MPVHSRWENDEKSIFVMEYISPWSWEDLFVAMRDADSELDQLTQPCDVIHDWSKSKGFPPYAIANGRGLMPRIHPKTRIHIHVGTNSFFMSLWRTLMMVYDPHAQKSRFQFADSVAEARQKLREQSRTS